ncbi:hypothetical protein MTR_0243s0040 [Medicago truncatula]|uniref:Uncharacterized protein n=1 Tax=Medicago truncatula TaxID=3880 RepID=A0A072TFZ4_MEDTR|nr:hypothetical protein MTR_0243s0040 [Medicago truncatula]
MDIYTNDNGIGWHDFQWNMELHQYGTWNEWESSNYNITDGKQKKQCRTSSIKRQLIWIWNRNVKVVFIVSGLGLRVCSKEQKISSLRRRNGKRVCFTGFASDEA